MLKWSWKIFEVAGIGIYLHWTFLLIISWLFLVLQSQAGLWDAIEGVGFILALFGCVVLHELGHALTAKRFNVRTRDITLLPIGGIARLERIPEEPRQELLIALAGPAVNVVIAAVLFGIVALFSELGDPGGILKGEASFLERLMYLNLLLVAFNMLPAFPMDGGRVLRAMLAQKMEYVQATEVASSIGQGMAILFAVVAVLTSHWFLLFIAIFVYLGAQAEAHAVEIRWIVKGIPVASAMVTEFRTLKESDTLAVAIEDLLAASQHDFPVMDNGQVVGVLPRQDLLTALAREGRDVSVSKVMRRDFNTVEDTAMLGQTFEQMNAASCPLVPVLHEGKLVGLATLENIGEWIMVQSALKKQKTASSSPLHQ